MEKTKRKRLEKSGWKIGTAEEFLGLSTEEAEYVSLKLELSRGLRLLREYRGLTQTELAAKLASSQSRVAKMESADASVSLDLLVRALFALGARKSDIARLIKSAQNAHAA